MKTKLLTIALMMLVVSCSQKEKEIEIQTEWVELGLSVKWATMNVGATTPEGYGEYFAWGEIKTPKDNDYSWNTYKYCKGSSSTMTKYCTDRKYGIVDNKTTLQLKDDAAHVNWGGTWRMPTDAEWKELREQCTWTWIEQNHVNGYEITGKNGNSIFLPAAGCRSGTNFNYAGSNGFYYSSSLSESYSNYAYHISFDPVKVEGGYSDRYYGRSIRAVCP